MIRLDCRVALLSGSVDVRAFRVHEIVPAFLSTVWSIVWAGSTKYIAVNTGKTNVNANTYKQSVLEKEHDRRNAIVSHMSS